MAEWVRQIQTASISLEQETKKQRQAIEKKIGEAPKLGKKIYSKTNETCGSQALHQSQISFLNIQSLLYKERNTW